MRNLTLSQLEGDFAICKFESDMLSPGWAAGGSFYSITRTPDELSIICPHEQVPEHIQHQSGWKILKIEGPFEFNEIGVLASLTAPLADAQISLLTISTFDTDYLMIQEGEFTHALRVLKAAGHNFI
jgi:hypothetical protein